MEILQKPFISVQRIVPSTFACMKKEKEQKSKGIKTNIKNRFEIRLKNGKAEQTIEQLVLQEIPNRHSKPYPHTDRFSRLYFMGYIFR